MQLPKVNFLDELQVLHHSRQCARAMIPHHPCPRPRGPRLLYLFVCRDQSKPAAAPPLSADCVLHTPTTTLPTACLSERHADPCLWLKYGSLHAPRQDAHDWNVMERILFDQKKWEKVATAQCSEIGTI